MALCQVVASILRCYQCCVFLPVPSDLACVLGYYCYVAPVVGCYTCPFAYSLAQTWCEIGYGGGDTDCSPIADFTLRCPIHPKTTFWPQSSIDQQAYL